MRGMNDSIPVFEIPEWATFGGLLALSVEGARELVQLRVGFEVELASLEPVSRDDCLNVRIRWRCKQADPRPALSSAQVGVREAH